MAPPAWSVSAVPSSIEVTATRVVELQCQRAADNVSLAFLRLLQPDQVPPPQCPERERPDDAFAKTDIVSDILPVIASDAGQPQTGNICITASLGPTRKPNRVLRLRGTAATCVAMSRRETNTLIVKAWGEPDSECTSVHIELKPRG